VDAQEGREQLTPECRARFLSFVEEALMVRAGEYLDKFVARERAANITAGIEADFDLYLRDDRDDPTPTGYETAEQHAERVIK